MIEEKRCPSCSAHSCKSKVSLPIICIGLDLGNITGSLRFKHSNKTCSSCDVGMQLDIYRKFNPVVIIDLDGMPNPNISIDDIQSNIRVDNMQYCLYGIIATEANHFVAHVHRKNGWQIIDDLQPTVMKTMEASLIVHPVMLMYNQFRCDADGKSTNVCDMRNILIFLNIQQRIYLEKFVLRIKMKLDVHR